MCDKSEDVTILKERGNSSLKEQKYEEAVLHYTHAIKIDEKNHSLHSNRSLAFLRMQQFYLAMEDAKETIRLRPDWAKGYFRKAEVEFQTFNFRDALLSYKIALTLQPNDPSLESAIEKTKHAMKKDKRADDQIPWLGAAVGIIIGVSLVVADQIFTYKPTLVHPVSMVLTTFAIAIVGYGLAQGFRYYVKCQRVALLEPPVNLLNEKEPPKEENGEKDRENRPRYSKAQARQRFRKGKS